MIYSLLESLLEAIDKILSEGRISWGAIITALLFFNKINKYKEFRQRDKRVEQRQMRIESKIDDLMMEKGVVSTWSSPTNGSEIIRIRTSTTLYTLLQVVKNQINQRRMKMLKSKLSSRKLWLAIFGALFPVLNVELGINLDPNIVFAVLGVVVSGIAGLAHVDGKRAQAAVKALKESVPIDPNATYKDMFPTIKEVHDKVNKFLELAKTNDVNVLAIYPQLLELLSSYEQPEPVAIIPVEKVSA